MKIAVLGYAGSGKSYLSDCISDNKNIPVLHLDDIKWDKKWQPIDDAVVLPQVLDFMAKEAWIIDGYYTYLLIDERLQQADRIILLLLPRTTCFFSALKRTTARRKDGYKNDFNTWFIKFVLFGCRDAERRNFYAEIEEKYKDKTTVLKTRRQVNKFIKSLDEVAK